MEVYYKVLMLNFMRYYLKVDSKICTTGPEVTIKVTDHSGI